ncbi:hypothetical protein EL18_00560 [Nitratireductor basaltis]|uniref:Uncharacterized protein n=1 Tax=Nitratireductor basaltis TaxID=472175 RepID=A0A084U9A8_9HYPH|nr:hypothetical protein EL18_00560 [Nitratireductor basaltis]
MGARCLNNNHGLLHFSHAILHDTNQSLPNPPICCIAAINLREKGTIWPGAMKDRFHATCVNIGQNDQPRAFEIRKSRNTCSFA